MGKQESPKFNKGYKHRREKQPNFREKYSFPQEGEGHRTAPPNNTTTGQNEPQQEAGTQRENTGNPEAERRRRNIENALRNEYNAVGVSFSLSIKSVKKAYRKAALQHHPDKGGDPEIFKQLGNAVEKITKTLRTFLGVFPELNPDGNG